MDENELANRLYRRRSEAFHVNQILLSKDEPPALRGQCHDNVNGYVARHPNCKRVRGWLIGNHVFFVYFNAHSIVENEDGHLIDITPSQPSCLFLPHPGSDEEFASIIAVTPRILYELPSEEWPDLSELNLNTEDPLDE